MILIKVVDLGMDYGVSFFIDAWHESLREGYVTKSGSAMCQRGLNHTSRQVFDDRSPQKFQQRQASDIRYKTERIASLDQSKQRYTHPEGN
ncbi:hypothetical protein RRG08_043336 [Elysia crispata]|uniref:Uncharacterized protein n=1 Tax=Elysia crispata TaxID=231223 RepID=A0AAE1EDR4_9GAST|nr:hypothetical protein RRG08_043336 [Elysia crispata]